MSLPSSHPSNVVNILFQCLEATVIWHNFLKEKILIQSWQIKMIVGLLIPELEYFHLLLMCVCCTFLFCATGSSLWFTVAAWRALTIMAKRTFVQFYQMYLYLHLEELLIVTQSCQLDYHNVLYMGLSTKNRMWSGSCKWTRCRGMVITDMPQYTHF